MTDHQLFLFLAEVAVLFLAARVGGEIAARLGIPLHVGELLMGMALGPSLFGWLWPGGFEALFPPDVLQRSLLEIISWTGIIFLVLIAGLETHLGVLRDSGRAVFWGWLGGFILPFAGGFFLGMGAPDMLIPGTIDKPIFALFMATALSISAIPVIARILMDLNLYKTRLGMIILSTAIADDTIGWIVLALVAGVATGNGIETGTILRTTLLTGTFVLVAFTGRNFVRRLVRMSNRLKAPHSGLSMMFLLILTAGAVTQAIGVHLVLGAFVAAVLIGRVGAADAEAVQAIRHVGMGFFVPFFFAYTGIKVDLTTLRGSALLFTVVAVVVACLAKIVGAGLGARIGGLSRWEALAVGFGRNARGAMELVIAAIGLSIGVLTEPTYAAIVLIAVLTTIMAAPMLEYCIKHLDPGDVESKPELSKLSA